MNIPQHIRAYGKRHLLDHLRAEGYTDQDIEAQILKMPDWHDLRVHFAEQYAGSLPAEEQAAALKRLMPQYEEGTMKITVLTVPGEQPVLYVSANFVAENVDRIVMKLFGVQEKGTPHNWRGERVPKNDTTA